MNRFTQDSTLPKISGLNAPKNIDIFALMFMFLFYVFHFQDETEELEENENAKATTNNFYKYPSSPTTSFFATNRSMPPLNNQSKAVSSFLVNFIFIISKNGEV